MQILIMVIILENIGFRLRVPITFPHAEEYAAEEFFDLWAL